MTRCEYLTARCQDGCEVWLHPNAVRPHGCRCPRRPWTDRRRPVAEVLLGNEAAREARSLLPSEVLHQPRFSDDRILRPRDGMYVHDEMKQGTVVRSPLAKITGRRWWTVVRAAAHAGRPVDSAFDADSFARLEAYLGLVDSLVTCDVCGDDVKPRGLKSHLRSNSICRFLSAVAEVHRFWELGYRDPYLHRDDGIPTTWTELNSRVCWRNRLHIVRFPLWTAVMISMSSAGD